MEKKIRKAVSERLKKIRLELQLSQKEFGARIGTSNTYISTLESAQAGPGYYIIYKLTKYYNVNPLYLLHGKGPVFIAGKLACPEKRGQPPNLFPAGGQTFVYLACFVAVVHNRSTCSCFK